MSIVASLLKNSSNGKPGEQEFLVYACKAPIHKDSRIYPQDFHVVPASNRYMAAIKLLNRLKLPPTADYNVVALVANRHSNSHVNGVPTWVHNIEFTINQEE